MCFHVALKWAIQTKYFSRKKKYLSFLTKFVFRFHKDKTKFNFVSFSQNQIKLSQKNTKAKISVATLLEPSPPPPPIICTICSRNFRSIPRGKNSISAGIFPKVLCREKLYKNAVASRFPVSWFYIVANERLVFRIRILLLVTYTEGNFVLLDTDYLKGPCSEIFRSLRWHWKCV